MGWYARPHRRSGRVLAVLALGSVLLAGCAAAPGGVPADRPDALVDGAAPLPPSPEPDRDGGGLLPLDRQGSGAAPGTRPGTGPSPAATSGAQGPRTIPEGGPGTTPGQGSAPSQPTG